MPDKQQMIDIIKREKLIVIVRNIPSEKIVALAESMINGGINCMEVTLDQQSDDNYKNTLQSISVLCETFGDKLFVGVGTAMTAQQVKLSAQAGAKYVISPNVCREVIEETNKHNLVSIPGALTPTEIADAYSFGADFVKVFPISNIGVDYFKAIKAPLSHIPLLAVGGVRPEIIKDYSLAGACGFGVGGNLVNKQWIADNRFDLLSNEARRYRDAVEEIK